MPLSAIRRNFTLLVTEVGRQVDDARLLLDRSDPEAARRVRARDDYVNHLRNVVTSKAFRALAEEQPPTKATADLVQAIQVVAHNLENVADHAENVVDQTRYLTDIAFFRQFAYGPFFDQVRQALQRVEESLFHLDVDEALKICRAEFVIDEIYKGIFDGIMEMLPRGEHTGDLVTSIFICRYLERMGDALLNVGEAIISASVGDRLKINEYLALEESVGATRGTSPEHDAPFTFEQVAETRSGNRIGRVRPTDRGEESRWVLFKEGNAAKLTREREQLAVWEGVMPGLTPRVLGFQREGESAYLLLEYLEGKTFQKIALEKPALADEALGAIARVLVDLWDKTVAPGPVCAGFVHQLRARLPEVQRVHPRVQRHLVAIGRHRAPALPELLTRLDAIEQACPAPFSVLIHGDLNTDNVIYDPASCAVSLVDVNRSCAQDLTQDVAVFMLSNLRLPIVDPAVRRRLTRLSRAFYRVAAEYARRHGDATFDVRLALGLTRSMLTSTRFILNQVFAKALILRAFYLTERLLAHEGRPFEDFVLPLRVLGN